MFSRLSFTGFSLVFVMLVFGTVSAQKVKSDSINFPEFVFSPTENYHSISYNSILDESREGHDGFSFNNYDYVVPFGLGLKRHFISKETFQLTGSVSVNTQFIFRNENSLIMQGVRNTHLNTDFYLRLHNTFLLTENHKIRATLFHRSSHLGDDYVLLNKVESNGYWPTDETNYEALQVQYSYEKGGVLVYGGSILMLRATNRAPFEFQQGIVIKEFLKGDILENFFIGYDLKLLENNNFNPSIDAGIGYKTGGVSHVRLNYFSGHIPFSRLESTTKSSWVGVGLYVNVNSI